MEITQFTYFQQVGGIELDVIPAEITMGLERLAMFLQGKQTAFDLEWAPGLTWGDVYRESERQWSTYNFEEAPVDVLARRFAEHEDGVRAPDRARPAAACLRPGAEVLAPPQLARRPRCGLGHRAGRLHPPGATASR